MDIKALCKAQESYMIEMRRWFHRHPELSLKEEKTSLRIREELDKMGISYEPLPPNYGIMATIKGGHPGKTLLLRADIDALPVAEETGLPFASENPGVMHACGHDAHAAMMLGAAKVLNEIKDELHGTAKILFQVSEENGQGIQEVLEYLKINGDPDGVISLHIWSAIPEGEILLLPGGIFAGGSGFDVTVNGQGGHGARPDLVKDPIKAACDLVLQFSSITSNYYDVLDHSVVAVCKLDSGTMGNIFPSVATFGGGIRNYKPEGLEKIRDTMRRMAEGVGKTHDVDVVIDFMDGAPPVMCDPAMVARARQLVPEVEGLKVSPQTDPICASDDYSLLLQAYPGFYGILGGGKPGEEIYPQHHCKFDIDENAFRKGSEFMVRYAVDFLK